MPVNQFNHALIDPMKMKTVGLTSLLAVLTCAAFAPSAARATSISSTILELNGSTTQSDGNNQQLSMTDPAEISVAPGYDFTADFSSLMSINFIQITLTLQDGNSSAADGEGFDFDHLFLALDGIDTGIALNGFLGNGLQSTLTISGTVDSTTGAAILAALQMDGHLLGTIITDNTMDTLLTPNDLFVGNDALNAMTTLTLSDAVPEPTTVALIGAGLLLVLAPQARRFRKNL